MSKTVANLTVESLIANGISNLYCVPGIQNDHFFNALFDKTDQLNPVHARHEQGAAYMALGAALATGEPQAFCIVPGPGFLNASAALCTAYALNAPLFGVIGQIPSRAIDKQNGLLHEINGQLDILKTMTKHAERVVDSTLAADQLANAWKSLRHGRPRPVGLEIPVDLWLQETDDSRVSLTVPTPAPIEVPEDQITDAARLVTESKRPLIVVGSGAQAHSNEIRKLASLIGAGVIAFRTGHGVIDSTDPLKLNMPTGHALWPDCDLVIGLGTRLTTQKTQWGIDQDLKILHIDLDDQVLNRIVVPTLGIHADLSIAVPALSGTLSVQPDRSDWIKQIATTKAKVGEQISQELAPQLSWLEAIRSVLPERGIFVDELTQIGYVSRFAFPTFHPRTFLSTGYQGTLGWGIASAIGAAHARRDVPVVSIAGDGGAMFSIAELATAVHHKIPVNIIVLKDNAYGNVKSIQRDNYGARYIASDLTSPDFVMLAQSCGVTATQVSTPEELSTELAKAIANPGPNLIEVPVGEFPSPWKFINMEKVRGS